MKKTKNILSAALVLIGAVAMTGCFNKSGSTNDQGYSRVESSSKSSGGSMAEAAYGDMEAYESSDVHAIEQARPSIMVLPGDQTLKNFKMLTTEKVNGREYVIRDYQGYMLKDYRANLIISHIQDAFIKQGYPLNDFEQTLKQLNTQEALDMADGLEKDAKTMLLTTAQPDIILELNYYSSKDDDKNNNNKISLMSHNYKTSDDGNRDVSYTLDAIDAYTNKVVSTISATGLSGESTTKTLQADFDKKLPKMQKEIVGYFSDILTRGRDITVRVAVEKGCKVKLSDESIEGDTYSDWIIDYIKAHTVKGAYKMQRNTDNELYFVNCRIKLLNDDGTQYGVYDWARDLQKNLRTNLGLKVTNKSQGLGEVMIVVQGIK